MDNEIEKNEAPSPSYEDKRILWTRAGGRCEFPGCNEYLLEDRLTSHEPLNLGEAAHIVGQKNTERSPRGKDPLPIEERSKVENLMLLCAKCHHKIIDNSKLIPEYPKEVLLEYKKKHEDRIRFLTGLIEESETVVVKMIGDIRGNTVTISKEQIRKAVLGSKRYPRYLGHEDGIIIDLTGYPSTNEELYWQSCKSKIDEKITQIIAPQIENKSITHISLFAFSRIPLLIYLGYVLGDKIPTHIYQKNLGNEEDWQWTKKESFTFKWEKLQEGKDVTKVALYLSVSGDIKKVEKKLLPQNLTEDFTIYEIITEGQEPNRQAVQSVETLYAFRSTYQHLLRHIEKNHKGIKEIVLVPAVPLSIGIMCGRELLRDVSPSLLVYDRTDKGYIFTIKVN